MTKEGSRGLRFQEGDKVRDRAELGGSVLETWGNRVKVRWNELYSTWIDKRFLRLDDARSTFTTEDIACLRRGTKLERRAADEIMRLTAAIAAKGSGGLR